MNPPFSLCWEGGWGIFSFYLFRRATSLRAHEYIYKSTFK